MGLTQIAKLADEYRELGPGLVCPDDLETIFEAMQSDPALHYEHPEELVEHARVAWRTPRPR